MSELEDLVAAATGFTRGPATKRALESTGPTEGLRERKKRITRQLISDTATAMFLEKGFDAVRVTDVAEACGVSEKTVYNYFSTKESLLLDREPEMIAVVQRALGPDAPEGSPIEAFVSELAADVEDMTHWWTELPATVTPAGALQRFSDLVESTPSLRAAQRDMMDRVVQVTAEVLATRAGVDSSDPEPQIAATAICGLWEVLNRAMLRYAPAGHKPENAAAAGRAAIDELRRAARLIDTGLWSFGLEVQGTPTTKQFKQAGDAANEARKQVIEAVRAAKVAWRDMALQAKVMREQGNAHGRGPSERPDMKKVRAAHDEMRKAKRDVAEAKREAQRAARQVKAQAKNRRQPKPK